MDRFPVGSVINGHLLDVGASGSEDAPNVLVYFKAL